MRKLLGLFLIFGISAIAATNYTNPFALGWPSVGSYSNQTFALSTASNTSWFAFSYIPPAAITLQNVSIEISAVTGTLGASDLEVDVYSSTATSPSNPSASLATSTTSSQQTAGFVKFGGAGTGYNYALSANTLYYFVLKNDNSTPTTNYPTVRYSQQPGMNPTFPVSNCTSCSFLTKTTANSGGAWSTYQQVIPFVRLDFTDGSSAGMPYTNILADTTNVVQSAKEVGMMFVTQGVQLNVSGVVGNIQDNGTPTAGWRFGLWNCTGLSTCVNLGYTGAGVVAKVPNQVQAFQAYFSTPITLPPYATIVVTLAEASNSDATVIYYALNSTIIDADTSCTGASAVHCSTQLKPLGGVTSVGAYCTGTCTTYSNWTQSTTTMYGIALLLASASANAEFTPIPVSAPVAK